MDCIIYQKYVHPEGLDCVTIILVLVGLQFNKKFQIGIYLCKL